MIKHDNQAPTYIVSSSKQDGQMSKPFAVSAIVHGGLMTALVLYHLVGFEKPKPVIPTLRVDLVGLPDHLKNQTPSLSPPGGEKSVSEELQNAQKEAENLKTPKVIPPPKPDEMTVSSKKKKEKEKPPQKQKQQRDDKLKNALNRIKALSRIQDSMKGSGTPIKGNQVSGGNSLSGEAKEGDAATYYDLLRDHLQQHWELPLWLARKNLAAKVILYLDSQGRVRKLLFTQNSGNPQFDEAVRKAIAASEPFPMPTSSAAYYGLQGIPIYFPL